MEYILCIRIERTQLRLDCIIYCTVLCWGKAPYIEWAYQVFTSLRNRKDGRKRMSQSGNRPN